MSKYSYWNYLYDVWKHAWKEYRVHWGFKSWLQGFLTVLVWTGGIILLCLFQYFDYVVESVVMQIVMILSGLVFSIVCLFALGVFISPFKIHKKFAEKEIERDFYNSQIRITPSSDSTQFILYNLSNSICYGNLILLMISETIDFSPIKLLNYEGESDYELLPKIPVYSTLAMIRDNKAYCVGKNNREIELIEGTNSLVIRLICNFNNFEETINSESYWRVIFNKDNQTLNLKRIISNFW